MASGIPGGGPELYGGIPARSISENTNLNANNNPSPPYPISSYRSFNSQIFLDQTTSASPPQIPQIQQHRLTPTTPASTTLMGKRTLAEFQAAAHHHHQQQQLLTQHHHHHHHLHNNPDNPNPNPIPNMAALNSFLLRSVRHRMSQYHNNSTSPFPTFSPMELFLNNNNHNNNNSNSKSNTVVLPPPQLPPYHSFNNNNNNNNNNNTNIVSPFTQGHSNLHQQQQQQQQVLQLRASQSQSQSQPMMMNMNPSAMVQNLNEQQDPSFSLEKKLMVDKRLQELEKQLLEDDDNDGGDDDDDENDMVSVITSTTNSEWSETIHNLNLIAANSPNPISPSPTSSSSSSSSTSTSSASVTNTVPPTCTKQTLLEAASAVSEGRNDVASEILCRISIPRDNKLMDYLCSALKSRVNPAYNPNPVADMFSIEHARSTHSLYDLSPCFKLAFITANLAILEAAAGHHSIHVIDFHVGQGAQYVNLIHALSSARPNGKVPSLLKLTAVTIAVEGEMDRLTKAAGEMLARLADRLGVQFCFNAVGLSKPSDLSRASVGVGTEEEIVAVNLAFKLYRVPDESVCMENPRDELLRRVKGLSPAVVTLVEQEMNVNTAPFMSRVNEVYSFYGALLESIEATVTRENSERANVEKSIMRRVVNSVACEGRERVERCEVFGKWRTRFGMAGFVLKPMGQGVADSMRSRLNSGSWVNPGFTAKEESGGVCFGWMGKTLTVASSWR